MQHGNATRDLVIVTDGRMRAELRRRRVPGGRTRQKELDGVKDAGERLRLTEASVFARLNYACRRVE